VSIVIGRFALLPKLPIRPAASDEAAGFLLYMVHPHRTCWIGLISTYNYSSSSICHD
jgi:hypothetical protein